MGEQESVKAVLETIMGEIMRSLILSPMQGFEALELLRSTPLKLEEVIRLYPWSAEVLSKATTIFKDPFIYALFVDIIYQVRLSYRIASIQVEYESDEEDVRKFSGFTVIITDCTIEGWRRANDLVTETTRAALKRFGERVLEVYRMVTVECADAYRSKA